MKALSVEWGEDDCAVLGLGVQAANVVDLGCWTFVALGAMEDGIYDEREVSTLIGLLRVHYPRIVTL